MSEADQHLLKLVIAGDQEGWNQFIGRFQKRLLAFANRQIGNTTSSEDVVQETFLGFLKALPDFRIEANPESLLFQILRRRIADHFRKRGRGPGEISLAACQPAQHGLKDNFEHQDANALAASHYVEEAEGNFAAASALKAALQSLAATLQSTSKLRDLKIAEGLFYAGLRNKRLAGMLELSENEVAYVKHRLLIRIKDAVPESDYELSVDQHNPLRKAWEELRPTCPKRTTLGKYVMGLLTGEWYHYVKYHVDALGCTFCQANLDDLQLPSATNDQQLQQRLLQSTIGFLRIDQP